MEICPVDMIHLVCLSSNKKKVIFRCSFRDNFSLSGIDRRSNVSECACLIKRLPVPREVNKNRRGLPWGHVIFNLYIKIRLTNSFQCTQWYAFILIQLVKKLLKCTWDKWLTNHDMSEACFGKCWYIEGTLSSSIQVTGSLLERNRISPKIFLFQPGLWVKVCCVYYCTLVLNLFFLFESNDDVIVTSTEGCCVLYFNLVLE